MCRVEGYEAKSPVSPGSSLNSALRTNSYRPLQFRAAINSRRQRAQVSLAACHNNLLVHHCVLTGLINCIAIRIASQFRTFFGYTDCMADWFQFIPAIRSLSIAQYANRVDRRTISPWASTETTPPPTRPNQSLTCINQYHSAPAYGAHCIPTRAWDQVGRPWSPHNSVENAPGFQSLA